MLITHIAAILVDKLHRIFDARSTSRFRFTSVLNFVYQIQFVCLLSPLNRKPSNYFMNHLVFPKSPANNRTIFQECISKKRNFSVTRMEYKAFSDRMPYSWVITSLQFIGINNKTIPFTKKNTSYWTNNLHRYTDNKLLEREYIEIKCGII